MTSELLGPYRCPPQHRAIPRTRSTTTVARRFGFGGGWCGGDVYGYMTHLPVLRWGVPGSSAAPPSAA
jgi:hypothetical protein